MGTGRRPTLERALVTAIIQHILPDLTGEQLEALLSLRFQPQADAVETALTPENLEESTGHVDDDVREDIVKEVKKKPSGSTRVAGACSSASATSGPRPPEEPPTAVAAASSSSSSGACAPRGNTKRVPNVPASEDVPLNVARQFFPPGCCVRRDDTRHHRWICIYPDGPQKVYSEEFTDEFTPLAALKTLICIVWDVHERLERGSCPFVIDQVPLWRSRE